MAAHRARLERARLYLVTDEHTDDETLSEALAGGVDVLQLRAKDAPDDAVMAAAERFRLFCAEHGALFVVNDRPDLAVAARADGVHVGQDDASVADARAAVGSELAIGVSTHSREQLAAARTTDADYVCVGPVYATPTKPDYPAVGLDLVRHAAVTADRPWFAIGGIDGTNVREVAAAGAPRVAVVRAIRDAPDARAAAAGLRAELEEAPARVE
ncbi:MAG TPA: thiamine phosphate synthase [Thermoleophilaceae bacterium]|nr:thiamine phosphate synthase [Thermoleophilaceae bacterium]